MRMNFVINYEGYEIQYDEDEYSTSSSPRWIVKIGNEASSNDEHRSSHKLLRRRI